MVWTSANGPKCPVSPADRGEFMKPKIQGSDGGIKCAVCGKPCRWVGAEADSKPPFGGWYCQPCDAYTETDVEVED